MKHSFFVMAISVMLMVLTGCKEKDEPLVPEDPDIVDNTDNDIEHVDVHVYRTGTDLTLICNDMYLTAQAIVEEQADGSRQVVIFNKTNLADYPGTTLKGEISQDVLPGLKEVRLNIDENKKVHNLSGKGEGDLVSYTYTGSVKFNEATGKQTIYVKFVTTYKTQDIYDFKMITDKVEGEMTDKTVSVDGKNVSLKMFVNKLLSAKFVSGYKQGVNESGSISDVIAELFSRVYVECNYGGFTISTSDDKSVMLDGMSYDATVSSQTNSEGDLFSDGSLTELSYNVSLTLVPCLSSLQYSQQITLSGNKEIRERLGLSFYNYCANELQGLKFKAVSSKKNWSYYYPNFINTRLVNEVKTMDASMTLDSGQSVRMFKEVLYPILSDNKNLKVISAAMSADKELNLSAAQVETLITSLPSHLSGIADFRLVLKMEDRDMNYDSLF